jgi:hypothetical protein
MAALRFAHCAIVLLACAALAHAGGGPENVFLVVNSRGQQSKEVANHYIALRRIPADNVFYLPAPPDAFSMKGYDFREKILRPALREITERGLRGQIDYLVYSCEFPCQIDCTDLFSAPGIPAQLRPVPSLTGATYLYEFLERGDPETAGLANNYYWLPGNSVAATRAFRREYQWLPGGSRGGLGGTSYLLSTQLGFVGTEGNTVDEIIAYLKRSTGIDGVRPEGTFYYMQNPNIRSTVRHGEYPDAIAQLEALGLKAELGEGVVPKNAVAMLGLTTGSTHVKIADAGSKLVAGALVDNLTSMGGVLTRMNSPNPQTRISEYMRLGAAGASGTVDEPYSIAAKFPSPALHVHYARGASLAEAFYLSTQGPYQLLVLGDPLCRPWALIPKVSVAGVSDGSMLQGKASLTPTAALFGNRQVDHFEFYVDGHRISESAPGATIEFDTTQVGDGYHELRVVAVDDTPVETQGRWFGAVSVVNGPARVSVSSPAGPDISGPTLTLKVGSAAAGEAAVFHNGREVARTSAAESTLSIPTELLGRGPVTLEVRTLGVPPVRSSPLTLTIE